eukprot:scaffold842_cov287-Chaetoceros_neogracile.AAC.5
MVRQLMSLPLVDCQEWKEGSCLFYWRRSTDQQREIQESGEDWVSKDLRVCREKHRIVKAYMVYTLSSFFAVLQAFDIRIVHNGTN